MAENPARPVARRMLTPLWVVSLFVSLTETVLGIAVTQTHGGIQAALTGFVIFFPLLIAIGFYLLLWHKPHHMYAPAEYGQQVNVREYIEAITQRHSLDENRLYTSIIDTIRNTLTSDEAINELATAGVKGEKQQVQEMVSKVLDSIAEKTSETIRDDSFITIDTTKMQGTSGIVWHVPYEEHRYVSDLLDSIWASLPEFNKPPAFTYGRTWALRDYDTGRVFINLGSNYRFAPGPFPYDSRSLKEVGFLPGMRLEAVYL